MVFRGRFAEMKNLMPISKFRSPSEEGVNVRRDLGILKNQRSLHCPALKVSQKKEGKMVLDGGFAEKKLMPVSEFANPKSEEVVINVRRDLGNGSEVVYMPRFFTSEKSWEYFRYLDQHIPWTRPTIHVLGKPFLQPREVCYIASKGLKELVYSGHTPYAHSWDDYPPLKEILDEVHKAFPGSHFNSLLMNRYNSGNEYVGWHADVHKELYGPTPEIASVSFGCERDFFLKKKYQGEAVEEKHCFNLKHGSLLLMRGNTQRDWLHSVPKRAKAQSARINLTFRRVMQMAS
ncbi:hypothetical protein SSX86_026072 [Deinandra increscens subsp. villosa]|uniref:Fe2OG dioxygenase domain-containing protein n=1 Tax=Deinandra increscens subsp. villosa TaxID=3103831 RepID=A0AAP0CHG9_9ASTR